MTFNDRMKKRASELEAGSLEEKRRQDEALAKIESDSFTDGVVELLGE